MNATLTIEALQLQPFCRGATINSFVATAVMQMPEDPGKAGVWTKAQRDKRGWSAAELASRINGRASYEGDPTRVSQQVVSKWEQGNTKRAPAWTRYVPIVLEIGDAETAHDPHLHTGLDDASVDIQRLPTWAGLGAGGTGDDDPGKVSFSRDLVTRELRADPEALLAMVAEGNSMEPDFRGGDQILVDTRRKSLAQPGAFCIWDGDGHVVKFIEKVPDSEPQQIRLVSANGIYEPQIRLLEDVSIIGRVIWFGRRVQ